VHVYEKKVTFELMEILEREITWEHVAFNYENVTFNKGKIGIVAFIRLILLDFFLHSRPQIFFSLHLRPEGVCNKNMALIYVPSLQTSFKNWFM